MNSESPLNRQDRRRSGDFVMSLKSSVAGKESGQADIRKLRTSVTVEAGVDFLESRNCIATGNILVICEE